MKIQYKVRAGLEDSEVDFLPKPALDGSAGYDLVYVPDLSYLDSDEHNKRVLSQRNKHVLDHCYNTAGYNHSDGVSIFYEKDGEVRLNPGERFVFPVGFHIDLPSNVMAQVCSRSGLASKQGLQVLNAPGIVDPGFHGELKVILYNASPMVQIIKPYMRIAQLVFSPFYTPILELNTEFDSLVSVRGSNGFGSTGTGVVK